MQRIAKALASSASVIILYAFARLTGAVEMPPIEEVGQAVTDIGYAVVGALVSGGATYFAPKNKEPST